MNESWVILQGWVGSEINLKETPTGEVASFRIGCTPRYKKDGEWRDGKTSWFTVNTWRQLALNVAESVQKGDAVIIRGRLRTEVWEREDHTQATTVIVDAGLVAHDLNRGTSRFLRTIYPARPEDKTVPATVVPAAEFASAAL